ncbi:hypothetical protein [Pararhodobacter aggregans]|uniref:Histidine kinase n=1 Tax=Pararhodobacter aggregans TaxID=404875 RepID=A0A2T7UXB8_9RHOB|nr:hypothetical protein [Pararhodobacter aggregans]PTX05130.1 hypothetical protein C8N33_101544 [Pararhodobacter aggregans]PVE49433.1 hypothetical protein DDE23_03275 [Pararhodobacter aggregans]
MPSETGSRLKQLGLALLNATLMLVALVLLLAVVLVWQLRGLATDLRTDLGAMQAQVQAARTEAREALAALDDPERAGAAREDLRALVTRLEAMEEAPDLGDGALLHRLALAIIATAAQGLIGQGAER